MGSLNRPGQDERLGALQTRFRKAQPSRFRGAARRLLRDVLGPAGFLVLGAMLGGSAFIIVDALGSNGTEPSKQATSVRAPYYTTCREAFQDGRANIRRGEPGYRSMLDADNDGLACEPYVPLRD